VIDQERPSAVELEIEIAMPRLRLDEKLHAAVLPYLTAVTGSHAAHKAILDFKPSMDALGIMSQAHYSSGPMIAAWRKEVIHLYGRSFTPGLFHPAGGSFGNLVVHNGV
jgi:hypothetical protein